MGVINDKLQNILPKYSELKLSGKNLAQQYVSAFNTGMNIYQCINQLQGYIEWVIKAVNDVLIQWNEIVDTQIKDAINATKQATTEQFNIEWAKNKAQLDTEIKGMVQDQVNIDWQERENAINLKITGVSNDLSNFKTETGTKFTTTEKELTSLITTTEKELTSLITTTKEELKSLINTTIDDTIHSIYPIGSVYISLTETNPGTYLKGTWEQFGQGRTLVGEGSGNDGSTSMSFTANNTGGKYYSDGLNIADEQYGLRKNDGPTYYAGRVIINSSDVENAVEESSANVSLVQPYITVYFWKRVK